MNLNLQSAPSQSEGQKQEAASFDSASDLFPALGVDQSSGSRDLPSEDSMARSNPLINRAAVRRRALELARRTGRGRFTRVSESFLDDCERNLEEFIRGQVHRAPSIGKTL